MSGLNKIEAPSLAPQYGSNVKQTFEQIDQNFNVLANRELYKGDAGKDLIAANISWSDVFVIPTGESSWAQTITIVVDGVTYYVSNFAGFIESALGTLSSESDDVSAAIDGLKRSGSVTVCFEDKETDPSNPATVLSSIPFVFVDLRFRNITDFSGLANQTDMSCVITCTGVWTCTQNFPTLYYGEDDGVGNLYWKINGQNTSILASGPAGKDGDIGTIYVGLTDNMKLSYNNDQSGTLHGTVENINITYLLSNISANSEQYSSLSDQTHFPFITLSDWVELYDSPRNGTPILILSETASQTSIPGASEIGVPYYISNIYYASPSATSTVSKYNICYAHMNDNTVKNAIMNNVLTLPQSMPSGLGQGELPGYSIKERGEQTSGYSIFVPYGAPYKGLVISYVSDVNNPDLRYDSIKSKFRIAGSLAEGYTVDAGNIESSGKGSHAEGYAEYDSNIEASGKGAHAEGCFSDASTIYATGDGAHAEGYTENYSDIKASGKGAHVEGYSSGQSTIYATNDGAHVEGYAEHSGNIESSGKGSHAEGYSADQSNIYATGDGAHAEGYVEGSNNYISASGKGSHAEGYVDDVNIVAVGKGSHAEGSGTAAIGDFSHSMGKDSITIGDNSFVSGYQCSTGAYACIYDDHHPTYEGSVTITMSEVVYLNIIFSENHGINVGDWVYISDIDIDHEIIINGLLKCSAISGNTVQFIFNGFDDIYVYDKIHNMGSHTVDCRRSMIINVSNINRTPPSQDWAPYKADQSISMGNQCISLGQNSSSIGKSNVTIWPNESSQGCYNLPGYVRYNNTFDLYWISSLYIINDAQNDEKTFFTIGIGAHNSQTNTRYNSLVVSNKGNIYKSTTTTGGLTKI